MAKTGEVPEGSEYTPKELEKRVEDSVNDLPDRFDALFRDIEILYENEYLDVETWGDSWIDLLSAEEHPTEEDFVDQFAYSVYAIGETESPAIRFGRKLGEMTSRLMLRPGKMKRNDFLTDLMWGFIEGVGPQEANSNTHFKFECIEKLEERAETEDAAFDQAKKTFDKQFDRLDDALQLENERIREVLEAQEIEPKEWLVSVVKDEIRSEIGIKDVRATPLMAKVDSVEDVITHKRVRKTIEENNLIKKQQLVESIERSQEQIEDVDKWNDVSAVEVLLNVPSEDSASSRAIAEEVNTAKSSLPSVVKFGQYLSCNRDFEGEWWNGPAVLEIDTSDSDYSKWEWSLLPYGQILKHRVHARAKYPGLPLPTLGEARLLQDIPEDVVEAAIDELDSYANRPLPD